MSVLTVTGSALPDRTLPLEYTRTATFTRTKTLPTPEAIPTSTYTRSAAAGIQPGAVSSHHHSRTISSTILPSDNFLSKQSPPLRTSQTSPRSSNPTHSRQSSAGNMETMHIQRHSVAGSMMSSVPRRSTSSRSTGTNAPLSYVALMRKQKATVWCDRSQHTDQRLAAAQRAAKHRATLEVHGVGPASGRTSTISSSGGVVGKIRHGGVPKAPGYSQANMSGAGVPMRLSANEMLGDDETDIHAGDNAMIHGRSGSGKSSINSSKYRSGYPRAEQQNNSRNSSPHSGGGTSPVKEGIPEGVEGEQQSFAERPGVPHRGSDNSEDSFGEVKEMSAPNALQQTNQKTNTADDLRRRGSVDERAMSMGAAVRLFVANPDIDD